jgi:hypothetical protein
VENLQVDQLQAFALPHHLGLHRQRRQGNPAQQVDRQPGKTHGCGLRNGLETANRQGR